MDKYKGSYTEYTSKTIDTFQAGQSSVGEYLTGMDKQGWNIHSITPYGQRSEFLVVHWKNVSGSPK